MTQSNSSNRPRFLMCRPDHYAVDYEINPWMHTAVPADFPLATAQWEALRDILTGPLRAQVDLVPAVKGLPDLVFTANAGFVQGRTFIPSRFRHPERQGEETHFRRWFEANGYFIRDLPENCIFEGFGDALPLDDTVFAGYRFRSDIRSHQALAAILGRRLISLELADHRFYHLDTCFCPLETGDLLYYPGAFDSYGRDAIRAAVPADRLIEVEEREALSFCCNAVSVGQAVVMNTGAPDLSERLHKRGYDVREIDLSEFLKSGGSTKCLTLRLE